MNSLEIFSGVGGLAKGLENAGFRHLGLLEINKNACQSLRLNYPKYNILETDIRNFDFSTYQNIDLVGGGTSLSAFFHWRASQRV